MFGGFGGLGGGAVHGHATFSVCMQELMTYLWTWLLEVWCGCGASYASAPVSANYPLFSNVMITFILINGAAA